MDPGGQLHRHGAAAHRRQRRLAPRHHRASRPPLGPRLLSIAGAGFIGGGIFLPDPSRGFPPGTPPGASAISSWHGVLHQVSGSAGFLTLIVFCFVVARRYQACGQRTMAACSAAAGVLCAAGVATGGAPHGSLTLFIAVSIALLWATFTTARLTGAATRPALPPSPAGQ